MTDTQTQTTRRGSPEWRAKISAALMGVLRGGRHSLARYKREYMREYRRGLRRRPPPRANPMRDVWYD